MNKENNKRRFPGESSQHRPDKAEQRREEAQERQNKHNKLTPQERLAKLDTKFGVNVGAARERERLNKLLSSSKSTEANNTDIRQELPDDIMAEIIALNEGNNSKKKIKAKDRREHNRKSTQ